MSRVLPTLGVVTAVLLAGCAGVAPLPGDAGADTGTVSLYLSDEENAIDDFRHLNVTVTKVGLKKADANRRGGHHGDHEHHHRDRWVVADVEDQTVDLTRLQGPNATLLGDVSVENGTYEKAFVYVSDVNATLKNGSSADVELPHDRLTVKDRFRVVDGQTVDFVVDVTVVNRSGEYVVVPHASASGEDVPFCRVGGECDCDGHRHGTNETNDSDGHRHGDGSGGCRR